MSEMKETGEDNAMSSFTSQEEPGTSITTPEAEERVGDAVQGTPQEQIKACCLRIQSRGKIDNTLSLKKQGRNLLIDQIYVDDIIFGATANSLCEKFANLMGSKFEMSTMGELNVFLGLQEKQSIKGTCISQKCIKELLKKVCHGSMGIIGSLLYLTASRPDIVFSVGLRARFQSNPEESHLEAAKKILRYLGIQNLVLYYTSGDNFNLISYANANYAGYLEDRKSTSEMAHSLRSCFITQ
ncbi:PREDICTED: uncharacterized protein LOC109224194 [Nicotiana attenuata]|uniref:uncharacterized protein LOC109224194 n=1 Tax=Nicotiana attenuata TaxID=49451 RepID=UPI000904A479|nr:PREDICTED: uncharacterized protein LOC109224194 [Nicotiana attenuata]